MTIPGSAWYTSSYSKNQGQCVEVALRANLRAVRESQNPDGGHLEFSPQEWLELIIWAKAPLGFHSKTDL